MEYVFEVKYRSEWLEDIEVDADTEDAAYDRAVDIAQDRLDVICIGTIKGEE